MISGSTMDDPPNVLPSHLVALSFRLALPGAAHGDDLQTGPAWRSAAGRVGAYLTENIEGKSATNGDVTKNVVV